MEDKTNNKANNKINNKTNKKLYVILLASGNSSRFGDMIPKQIYKINGKCVIQYSIESILPLCPDKIIIVTDRKSVETINSIVNTQYKNKEIFEIILNNTGNSHRLDSIGLGLEYLKQIQGECNGNIIIHDVARPWVTTDYYDRLLSEMQDTIMYVQYCVNISGGLINTRSFDFVDRSEYAEVVTPLVIRYDICKEIYDKYLKVDINGNRNYYEFVPILRDKKYNFKLIYGNYMTLRKITYIEDV